MAVKGVRHTDLKPKPKKAAKGGAKGAKGPKGAGKGKGGGSTQGTWAWIATAPVKKASVPTWQKGGKGNKGKGKGKRMPPPVVYRPQISKGKGKGNGKGIERPDKKFLDQLQDIDASLKVWVGGLDEKMSWKSVTTHFKEIGKAKVALMAKGKACLAFKTADEVDNAIATLNGSELGGKTIEVDVWTQREKREPGEKKEKVRSKKLVKTGFASKVANSKVKGSGKAKTKTVSRFLEKLRAMDHSLKVWVGSLTEKVTIKMLMQHFNDLGCKVDVAEFMKLGSACVGFKTSDEAESAIASVNGSDLDGESITVDVWAKPEKKEKKK